jgi:hypothetical protein
MRGSASISGRRMFPPPRWVSQTTRRSAPAPSAASAALLLSATRSLRPSSATSGLTPFSQNQTCYRDSRPLTPSMSQCMKIVSPRSMRPSLLLAASPY